MAGIDDEQDDDDDDNSVEWSLGQKWLGLCVDTDGGIKKGIGIIIYMS